MWCFDLLFGLGWISVLEKYHNNTANCANLCHFNLDKKIFTQSCLYIRLKYLEQSVQKLRWTLKGQKYFSFKHLIWFIQCNWFNPNVVNILSNKCKLFHNWLFLWLVTSFCKTLAQNYYLFLSRATAVMIAVMVTSYITLLM